MSQMPNEQSGTRQQDQQDKLDNNRGGADPTGGQAIDEGRGPGENIAPRPGAGVEKSDEAAASEGTREDGDAQPRSMGQSAEQPAEGWQSEEDLARQNPD
jgi:hypothetical protein